MTCSCEILALDKKLLATVYDKHTTTFQTVITKIQTFSIYGINMFMFLFVFFFFFFCSLVFRLFLFVCLFVCLFDSL